MNKKEFLSKLEKKLQVLDSKEIKDIIDEYEGIIDEKVKNGKTEEEAVKDFGETSELVEEILSAYKINPEYGKTDDSFKKFLSDGEVLIKKGASKLADSTEKLAKKINTKDSNSSLEAIFEIFIKILILLVIFAILRLPFELLIFFGEKMLEIAFYPLDVILHAIWVIIVWIFYMISCAMVIYLMFKKDFEQSTDKKGEVKKDIKKTTKSEQKKNKEVKQEELVKTDNSVSTMMVIVLKILVLLFFYIPLLFTNIGLYIALVVVLFFIFKGINIIGLGILMLGLCILASYVFTIVENLVFKKKKIYTFPLIIGAILVISGSLVFLDEAMEFDYSNTEPKTTLTTKTLRYEEKINRITDIDVQYGTQNYITDNDLEDGAIILEVSYYSDLVKTRKVEYHNHNNEVIEIGNDQYKYNHKVNRILYETLLDNLEDKKIYNYSKLFQTKVNIYANSKTMELLK
ncbi:MAG: DUF1700 domain-containing protein [Bacilli bacterium]|nr:DUF1700 domain-containing protein [Bacilli bacterium]MDD4808499.1 DUF1700 domain-containing protein [Bacilli bacterium]